MSDKEDKWMHFVASPADKSIVKVYIYQDLLASTEMLLVGIIKKTEDNYYQFFPLKSFNGYWPRWLMREITDKVDEMNKVWDDEVNEYFDKES